MILRKITIFGFKSFYNKTEMSFGDGLTAIIGPNGCGKSNVVDAIRWVFGEQKLSMLRSVNMQDVIFSGTQQRQPLNMAEVTITLENNRGILPIEYREVAVTRRIFRNGECEYLINKSLCRLRDIHDLFLDTGVGSNAYTTIENNMINKILSDKAEERRVLFEEAAGIGKYKQRIKESQRKLDKTKQDLLRISDRIQEKDKYVRMLARHVEKARRYKRYRDDLLSLEVGFENRNYMTLSEAMESRRRDIKGCEDEHEKIRAGIAGSESQIEEMEISKVEKENELQIASQNLARAGEKINEIDREISMCRQNLSFQEQNIGRFEQEAQSFDVQIEEKRSLVSNIKNGLVDKETALNQHVERVKSSRDDAAEFDIRLLVHKERLNSLVARNLKIVHEAGEKQRLLSTCQTNLNNCMERRERDEREIKSLQARIEEYLEESAKYKEQLKSESAARENYIQSRDLLWSRVEKEDEHYHECVENENRIEARIDSGKTQLKFLEGLNASFEGYDSGVKALLTGDFEGRVGILADCIRVDDPQIVSHVEKILGTALQTLIFKTDSDLRKALDFLGSEDVGSARMISIENLERISIPETVPAVEGAAPLRPYINAEPEFAKVADLFFNHILLGESDDLALTFQATARPGTLMISRRGVIGLSDGTVIAGSQKKDGTGILQRRQKIEKLIADIEAYQKEYEKAVHEKEICIITRDEAKRALIEVDEKLNRGLQKQQEQETNIKHYEKEVHNIKDKIRNIQTEIESVNDQISEYELKIHDYEAESAEISATRSNLENEIEDTRSRLVDLEKGQLESADRLKSVELSMQDLKNRIEQDKQSIVQMEADIGKYSASKQQKIEDKNNACLEIKGIEEKLVFLKESIRQSTEQRDGLSEIYTNIREEYNGILFKINEIRKTVKAQQCEMEKLLDRKHEMDVRQTRDEEKRRAIRERIYNSYEIDLESPPEDIPVIESADEDILENIQVLKERLKRVGEVNLGAPEEFETENNELNEMVSQRDDLQTAVDDLEKAIKKLNREARSQFLATIEEVQRNFSEMFTTLFEGGEARISLDENADPLDAAIFINVRPAGKKMRGVTLLSGGERALTAISLLFALYKVKPSAYCILDELDAPLDDANIDRFLRILTQFSNDTQFIVVTHNKKTMEAADVLYGVTQQESGISTIASVKVSDVELKAA